MSEFDALLDPDAPIKSTAEKKGWTRGEAVDYGCRLGEDEARRRNENPEWAADRVRRAMAYAAWEYDGKPVGRGGEYRKEFGITDPNVSDPRVRVGSDFVEKRK